jgi:4-carboxymuconolactone decarboxylase
MSSAQRAVYDAVIAGKRGRAPLPLLAWLASPEFAQRAQSLGEFARYETTLAPRLSELAILLVAHHWQAAYEWASHKKEALRAGVEEKTIAAIAAGQTPSFAQQDELAVYEFSQSLLVHRAVEESLYRRAAAALGERGVVELVGVLGYYTLIAMTLNVFEILPAAEG